MKIMACDPGIKGAFALLGVPKPVADLMPLCGKDIDGKAIADMLRKVKPDLVILEKVHSMPKQGVSSTFKFGESYGRIKGILEGLGIPYQLVTPQAWKKEVLKGTKKDKDAAIQHVRRKYPTINLTPKPKRTPQDGIADAVCIAEYGVLMNHKE